MDFQSPLFFAHFQAILIFETKKVIIWFHFENRTKPGTVLTETVLSGDPLYYEKWVRRHTYFLQVDILSICSATQLVSRKGETGP